MLIKHETQVEFLVNFAGKKTHQNKEMKRYFTFTFPIVLASLPLLDDLNLKAFSSEKYFTTTEKKNGWVGGMRP